MSRRAVLVAQAVQVQLLSPAPIRDTRSQIDDPIAVSWPR
jgi:hypothetical protein